MPPQGSLRPGQTPTPQQMQAIQQQLSAEAAKRGISIQEYVGQLKADAMRRQQQQQQQQGQQPQGSASQQQPPAQNAPQQGQQVPINPGPPDPKAVAVAKWLRSQDLKSRTCIFQGQRKDMFKVKRALRALQSPAYTAAQKKNPALLPPVTDVPTAVSTFKLLPMSLLSLRVSKIDPSQAQPNAKAPKKSTKGLWTVKVEQHQDVAPDLHYMWLYEGPQWRTKVYAALAVAALITIIMFPLWPVKLRLGVYYLSMAMLGLIGLFFAMAIFRLILFCVTVFVVPPGLWLYPNLFEDVGFFDSFRPLWGWQEDKKAKKSASKSKKSKSAAKSSKDHPSAPTPDAATSPTAAAAAPTATDTATTTGSAASATQPAAVSRAPSHYTRPQVEEVGDDE
ncbi:MAG: hypothetical protein M1819_005331 [Sarea resinae]|nr:MAG: hypothetical protein M1819_005331 [Sarea resinae]